MYRPGERCRPSRSKKAIAEEYPQVVPPPEVVKVVPPPEVVKIVEVHDDEQRLVIREKVSGPDESWHQGYKIGFDRAWRLCLRWHAFGRMQSDDEEAFGRSVPDRA